MPYKHYKDTVNSFPQLFVDKALIKCPLCDFYKPLWSLDQKIFFLKPFRFFFQCPNCKGVVSFLASDISGMGLLPYSMTGLVKIIKGRKSTSVLFRIEQINVDNVNNLKLGDEIDLRTFQTQ
jgi:hypothetical protein